MTRKSDGWAKDIPKKGDVVALRDGPSLLDGSWWWQSELERHQQACWAVHRDWRTKTPNPICGYQPTGEWINHPAEVYIGTDTPVSGRVWAWSEPRSVAAGVS